MIKHQKAHRYYIAALFGIFLITGMRSGFAASGKKFRAGQIVVQFKPSLSRQLSPLSTSLARMATVAQGLPSHYPIRSIKNLLTPNRHPRLTSSATTLANDALSNVFVIETDTATDIPAMVADYNRNPNVDFAEPNWVYKSSLIPNDPSYSQQYGLAKISAPQAWDVTQGSPTVVIAVIDSGVDITHPDLRSSLWNNSNEIPNNGIDDDGNGYVDDVNGFNFVAISSSVLDDFGHGTHVAGIAAGQGNNGVGIAGVSWKTKIMSLKGLNENGSGYTSDLTEAIIYAADNGARVINNSWGGGPESKLMAHAINYATGKGVVVVCAAGNDSTDEPMFPAAYPNTIAVVATDRDDQKTSFSNFGNWVHVSAPGLNILSTLPTYNANKEFPINYGELSGTSMATPFVAGLAALIISHTPALMAEEVAQIIKTSADDIGTPGFDNETGWGRINAFASVNMTKVIRTQITSPRPLQLVTTAIDIKGTVSGLNFSQYKLERSDGSSWITLAQSNTPVVNGKLGTFNPAHLKSGSYTIRLTATDTSGGIFRDQIEVVVDFVSISNPVSKAGQAYQIKPGLVISIQGRATPSGLVSYQLEWARGVNPLSGWSSTGITLTNGGLTKVDGGELGLWDTTGLNDKDFFTLRLTANDGTTLYTATTTVYAQMDLLSPQWPKKFPAGASDRFIPVKMQSKFQLAHMGWESFAPPSIWSFSADGSTIDEHKESVEFFQRMAAGSDIGNNNGFLAYGQFRNCLIQKTDASTIDLSSPRTVSFQDADVIIKDLDGDDKPDIIASANVDDRFSSSQTELIFAWKSNGTLLSDNFPVELPQKSLVINSVKKLVVADLDRDDSSELIFASGMTASSFTITLFNWDGSPKSSPYPSIKGIFMQMAASDIDGDGKTDLIIMTANIDRKSAQIHVFEPNGSYKTGWPVIIPELNELNSRSNFALGDLDGNGKQEIVYRGSYLATVLKSDGKVFSNQWPLTGLFDGDVVLADVTGDSKPEILLSQWDIIWDSGFLSVNSANKSNAFHVERDVDSASQHHLKVSNPLSSIQASNSASHSTLSILALKSDASIARQWNLFGIDGEQPASDVGLTIGDFDGSGTSKMAVTWPLIYGGGLSGWILNTGLAVFDLKTPFSAAAVPWSMLNGNPENSGTGLIPEATSYYVKGFVKDTEGNPLEGATVTLTTPQGKIGEIGTTKSGFYSFTNLPENTYSIVVHKNQYLMSPPFRIYPALNQKVKAENFVGETRLMKLISIIPNTSPSSGGQKFHLHGSGFIEGMAVLIGENSATNVSLISSTDLEATAPPGAEGPQDVRIISPENNVAVLAGAFSYIPGQLTIDPAVKAYPNPIRPTLGQNKINFVNLAADASLKIYTLSGELVYETKTDSTGKASWNLLNLDGNNITSGVYPVLVGNGDNSSKFKIVVQR